jgi:hypothetical protein
VTQQKIIGIPQVYSFSLKFEVHSFFGSLNVYVKERANTFQFASLGRKADSLLSAHNETHIARQADRHVFRAINRAKSYVRRNCGSHPEQKGGCHPGRVSISRDFEGGGGILFGAR